MIIHKLIFHHLVNRDDPGFYLLQACDAMAWMEKNNTVIRNGVTVLDLGCGHGIFGAEFKKRGCLVTFADETNSLHPSLAGENYRTFNVDKDDVTTLGQYDIVLCSNVYEHLSKPEQFLANVGSLLKPSGRLFLSWTNWLSPWGGHEFSPFHYLGATRGHLVYDKLTGKKRIHTPFKNLYPTYIGHTLRQFRQLPTLRLIKVAPRYYPEFAFLMHLPVVREFLAWNCAVLAEKR